MQTDSYQQFLRRVGRQVRAARKARDISQEKLGELVGMDRVSIGYIEQARRAPSLMALHDIANKLEVDVSYFFLFDNSEGK